MVIVLGGTWLNPLAVAFGALLPDADHRRTLIGTFIPLWLVFKHRTWTHTWWGLMVFSGIVALCWNWKMGAALALGYFSHLLLDACTPSGVKWWGKR